MNNINLFLSFLFIFLLDINVYSNNNVNIPDYYLQKGDFEKFILDKHKKGLSLLLSKSKDSAINSANLFLDNFYDTLHYNEYIDFSLDSLNLYAYAASKGIKNFEDCQNILFNLTRAFGNKTVSQNVYYNKKHLKKLHSAKMNYYSCMVNTIYSVNNNPKDILHAIIQHSEALNGVNSNELLIDFFNDIHDNVDKLSLVYFYNKLEKFRSSFNQKGYESAIKEGEQLLIQAIYSDHNLYAKFIPEIAYSMFLIFLNLQMYDTAKLYLTVINSNDNKNPLYRQGYKLLKSLELL